MAFAISARLDRGIIAAIMILALVVRVLAAIVIPDQSHLLVDAVGYRESAVELLRHGHTGNPYQMPLYPLLLAITGSGIGQMAADIVLSVLLIWIVWALTIEIFADRTAAALAALATACYPPLIFFSVVGLTETLFITLVVAAFLSWYRANFTIAAVFAVLAILTRPIFDLFAPLMILTFALAVHRLSLAQTIRRLIIYAFIYIGLMAPWWISNYHAYDRFVRLTAGGGTALYTGNNPLNKSGGAISGQDYDLKDFNHIENLADRDSALRDAALNFIRNNPIRFFELAVLKFGRIWSPWPINQGYRNPGIVALSILSFVPVIILAGIGMFMKRDMVKRLAPIYLFGVGYTVVNMIIAGTIRYRLPLEPFLLVFAAVAASEIGQRVFKSYPVRL